jgi:hypothetical protein
MSKIELNQKKNRKSYKGNKLNSILLIFISFLFMNIGCKKEKSLASLEWMDESLRLTSEICKKFNECGSSDWSSVPENKQKFVNERLSEANCQKRFRDSVVYKLNVTDPVSTQSLYRQCHESIIAMNCPDIQSNKIDTIASCNEIKKIQNR